MSRFSRRVAPGEISLSGYIEREAASHRDKRIRLRPRPNDNVYLLQDVDVNVMWIEMNITVEFIGLHIISNYFCIILNVLF